MPPDLKTRLDDLIAWAEANSADPSDLRETLTTAGLYLGERCDQARKDELAGIHADRSVALAASGKTPLFAEPAEADAAVAPALSGKVG